MMTTVEQARGIQIDPSVFVADESFAAATRSLIGLKVALARQGYGSALRIELGRLTPGSGTRQYLRGEASIVLEWSWRFETASGVAFGSSSAPPYVYAQLLELRGQRVTGVTLEGRCPELILELGNGLRARSLTCVEGDPGWWLWLPDKSSLHWEDGAVRRERPGTR